MKLKNHVLQPRPSDENWPSYEDYVDSKIFDQDPLKTLYLFLYLSEEAYLKGFILSRYSKFLGVPFMVRN